jgi:hypothetical protein
MGWMHVAAGSVQKSSAGEEGEYSEADELAVK